MCVRVFDIYMSRVDYLTSCRHSQWITRSTLDDQLVVSPWLATESIREHPSKPLLRSCLPRICFRVVEDSNVVQPKEKKNVAWDYILLWQRRLYVVTQLYLS